MYLRLLMKKRSHRARAKELAVTRFAVVGFDGHDYVAAWSLKEEFKRSGALIIGWHPT